MSELVFTGARCGAKCGDISIQIDSDGDLKLDWETDYCMIYRPTKKKAVDMATALLAIAESLPEGES